ncbi:MAG: hypothetical protein AAB545_03255 [Patescibacteria group bacterium]
MRRIRIASFFLGLSFTKIFLSILAFASAGELFWNISFLHVFRNSPSLMELALHENFWQSAWGGTEIGVQIAVILLPLLIIVASFLQIFRLRKEKLPHPELQAV